VKALELQPLGLSVGVEAFVKGYVDILGKILLWISLILFIMATAPKGVDGETMLGIIAGLVLFALMSWQWVELRSVRYQRVLYAYVVLSMCVMIIKLLPLGAAMGTVSSVDQMSFAEIGKSILTHKGTTLIMVAVLFVVMVSVPAKYKMAMKVVCSIAVATILFAIGSTREATSPSTTHPAVVSVTALPSASLDQPQWLSVSMDPKKDSGFIPRPPGMHIMLAGKNFVHVMKYQGGQECSYPSKCPEGSIGSVARNLSDSPNVVKAAIEAG